MNGSVKFCISRYTFHNRKFTNNPDYKFNYNDPNVHLIISFLQLLRTHNLNKQKTIEKIILYAFCVLSKVSTVDELSDIKNAPMSYVFGEKNLLSWKDSTPYNKSNLFNSYKSRIWNLKNISIVEYTKKHLIPIEESQKARFLNEENGLAYCMEMTTLYSHFSKSCTQCVYKQKCKDILSINYPEIYNNRGYGH